MKRVKHIRTSLFTWHLHHNLLLSSAFCFLIRIDRIISKMTYPMKVQLNSIEKRKISHFFSVLFRSAGRMSIMIAGRPTIKVQNVKPNPMLESSPITPSKNHPRVQRITGMVAMAIMMRFAGDFFSGFFQASLRSAVCLWEACMSLFGKGI